MILKVRNMLWLLAWSTMVAGLALAATPCLPMLELDGASQNPQRPWMYVTRRPMQVKVKPIPSEDCEGLPSDIMFCWYVDYKQGGQLPPVPWETVAQCKNQTGPVLEYAAYTLLRANYTVQVVAMLPDTQEPLRCVTGYFVVPPTPRVPLYFRGGLRTVVPHRSGNYLIVAGGRDPDKRPDPLKSHIMKLEMSWECSTNDLNAKTWCDGDLQNVNPDIFQANTILDNDLPLYNELYAIGYVNVSYIRPGYIYNFKAKARETEWPYRTAEATTERHILNTGPAPIVWIKCYEPCDLQRMLPTDELRLEAICDFFHYCIDSVSIFYQWMVDQEGVGPVDLTVHSVQGKGKGVGLNKLTIRPGAFKPGAKIKVHLRTNYYPTTPDEVNIYQYFYDDYKEFQENKPG